MLRLLSTSTLVPFLQCGSRRILPLYQLPELDITRIQICRYQGKRYFGAGVSYDDSAAE
jgi:hypothetical protein